jgi:MFS family permease
MGFTDDFFAPPSLTSNNYTNETGSVAASPTAHDGFSIYDNMNITITVDKEDPWGGYVHPKIFSIGPLIFGLFSAMGSYVILREVTVDQRQRRGKVIPRILMGLSVADMFFSLAYMMSTFASPSELTYRWGTIGNQQTCTTQGFFIILGYVASPLYNAALSIFYALSMRYKTDQELSRYEPWVHCAIWTIALTMSSIPLPLQMYNNLYEACWVASAPLECWNVEGIPCTRGEGASAYLQFLVYFPVY